MTEKEALFCNTASTELAVSAEPPPPAERNRTLCKGKGFHSWNQITVLPNGNRQPFCNPNKGGLQL